MFPSSDPAIPNLSSPPDDHGDHDAMPSTADAMDCEVQVNGSLDDSINSLQDYPTIPLKASYNEETSFDKPAESTFEVYSEYAPVRSPTRSSKVASYSQLNAASKPSYAQPRGSLQSTPDSTSDLDHADRTYEGHSDIPRRSASSTEADLFSDVEEDDLEDSGFEPTEVAELPIEASGALQPNTELITRSSEGIEHSQQAEHLSDSDDEDDDQFRLRTASYESYPNANSPTESQLIDEGFEFHNQLPEHRQAGQFQNEAFREALRDVSPHLPRKQQWYAWRKVMEMLDNEQADDKDDLFDDSDLPNDFSLGSLAEHNFGGCHCGGDAARCNCAPSQCACDACPRSTRLDRQSGPADTAERAADEEQDVPMVIGYTPITPLFPDLHRPQQSIGEDRTHVQSMLPGLGHLHDDSTAADAGEADSGSRCGCSCGESCQCSRCDCPSKNREERPPAENAAAYERTEPTAASQQTHPDHTCRCASGDKCPCPSGECQCNESAETPHPIVEPEITVDQLFEDPFKRPAAYGHPHGTWSDAATAGQSPTPADLREPRGLEPHYPQIASQLHISSIFSPNDAPTPAQGLRSPESEAPTPLSQPISRPDTPRPQGDTYQFGIRQSVEPEVLSPVSHRLSTPAYENRSLTPSPMSHNTPSDTSMLDATPTQPPVPAVYERESSVLPDAPPAVPEALSPPDSPPQHIPPVPAIPAQHRSDHLAQYAQIPTPPIPVSPTLKPRKQRATSTAANGNARRNTKSAVHGSKITKAQPKQRNVTRKATGKKVKAAVDRIEDTVRQAEEEDELQKQRVSSRGSVKSWDSEEVMQKDGSPPRRSARVRQRAGSPLVH